MNPLCEDRENRHCQLRPFRITILGDDSKGTKMGSSENPGLSEGQNWVFTQPWELWELSSSLERDLLAQAKDRQDDQLHCLPWAILLY
ncbi:hypothetical protein Lal_00039784 [Lupinus albus]|nr:hypothetical protein Lal_00039784 [Lupinus albus]